MFDHIWKTSSKPRKARFVKLSSFLDLVNDDHVVWQMQYFGYLRVFFVVGAMF